MLPPDDDPGRSEPSRDELGHDGGLPLTEHVLPEYALIDRMGVRELAETMNRADETVPAAVRRALPTISDAIAAAGTRFSRGGRLVYLGAGTSGRLGVLDAAECPPTFHIEPARVIGLIAGGRSAMFEAVEGAEDDEDGGGRDLLGLDPGPLDTVVGITASGRTPYVIGALRAARSAGALTISIACSTPSAVAAYADHAIEVPVGGEVLAGSTRLKAGTAQKQVLNMISTIVMIQSGRTYGNLMVDLHVSNAKLTDRAIRIIVRISGADREHAARALAEAGNEVKTAIAMLRFGEDADAARARLAAAGGRLADVIGSRDPGSARGTRAAETR